MNDDERTIIKGLDAPAGTDDYAALRALTDADAGRVAMILGNMVETGLVTVEEGEYFATAAGVRAAYAN